MVYGGPDFTKHGQFDGQLLFKIHMSWAATKFLLHLWTFVVYIVTKLIHPIWYIVADKYIAIYNSNMDNISRIAESSEYQFRSSSDSPSPSRLAHFHPSLVSNTK